MEINQPKSIKLKMRGHKLVSGVNLQAALKQNLCKTNGHKTKAMVHMASIHERTFQAC